MGVMACSRAGCENPMCERYSSKYGYICSGCFDELCHAGVGVSIREFMESERDPDKEEADFAYFDALFSLGDD